MANIANTLSFFGEERRKNTEARKRVGRGRGSGLGKTCGSGGKGQTARSGCSLIKGFEGGQTPLYRRMPIVGFNNYTRVEYQALNVETVLYYIAKGVFSRNVTIADLISAGLMRKNDKVKLLGTGKVDQKIAIQVHAASKSAVSAVSNAGGQVEILGTSVGKLEVKEYLDEAPITEKKEESESKPGKAKAKVAKGETGEEAEEKPKVKKPRAKKVTETEV